MIVAGKNLDVPKYDLAAVRCYIDEKAQMYANYTTGIRECRGADEFMQNRLSLIEMSNQGVEFPRTDVGKIQLSGKDKWILKKYGVKDNILDMYMDYKHKEKLLSTYLNPDHVWPDGRVHTRFENYLRTGRTSSAKPNIQNVPGSDGIRAMYIPKSGHYMASIDYSQLELCSLAQHCYTVLGKSRMRELINARIDIHSWFAGRTAGIITDENDYDGSEESRLAVIALCEDIKDNHKKLRKNAKAANFGFPGGMSAKTFLNTQRAYGDTEITLEDCDKLRTDWFNSFPEMAEYMQPVGDTVGQEDKDRFKTTNLHLYQAENCAGVKRRKCTFNSACNFPFQSLAAVGAKRALWKVWRDKRYSHLMINFIHDEILFELPIETAARDVKVIQHLMEEAMREIITDVRIEAEGCLMEEWDKRAEPVYDLFGNLTVWRPEEAA
jgi:DNA polymerase I-like protein with 3'-5' exonuclease and polymerase domains